MSADDLKDVNRTVAFTTQKLVVGSLASALALLLLGLVALRVTDGKGVLAGWILTIFASAGIAYIFWRRTNPGKPMLVLSPAGLSLRIPAVKVVLIPWPEILGIETEDVDITLWLSRGPTKATLYDVTGLLVSKDFYERYIHVDSWFMRGPGWEANFRPKGDLVQVFVHHEPLSVDAKDLRAAIEARWLAFRDRPASFGPEPAMTAIQSAAPRTPIPARTSRAITTRRGWFSSPPASAAGDPAAPAFANSSWEILVIVLAIAGIAVVISNFAGIWETEDQKQTRIERQKWADEVRRDREERLARDKKWDDFWRDFDRSMPK